MREISTVLTLLSAMITPAVLILASGSLLTTTSQRLNRAIDRARGIADMLEDVARMSTLSHEKKELLAWQLTAAATRARMLQQAVNAICMALAVFVSTSMSIGVVELTRSRHTWVPVVLGMLGITMLLYSTIVFVLETRIAYRSIKREMNFISKVNKDVVVPDKLKEG
jgi:uncharacterized membrane protein (UPF0136 family)